MRLKKLNLQDVCVIFGISLLISGITLLLSAEKLILFSYAISLFFLAFFVCLSWHIIRKMGSGILVFVIIGLLNYNSSVFGTSGIEEFATLVVAGLIFEFLYVGITIANKHEERNTIVSATLAIGLIPLIEAVLLAEPFVFENIKLLCNIVMLSGVIAFFGSVFFSMVWPWLKTKKLIIRLQTESAAE